MKIAYYKMYERIRGIPVLVASFNDRDAATEYLHQFPECFSVPVFVKTR